MSRKMFLLLLLLSLTRMISVGSSSLYAADQKTPAAGNSSVKRTQEADYSLPCPKQLTAKSAIGKVILSWTEIPGATSYIIYRREKEKGTLTKIHELKASSGSAFEDTTGKPGITYIYAVKAVRRCTGNADLISPFSKNVTSHSKINAVTMISAVFRKQAITISWKKLSGASGYRVYRREAGKAWHKLAFVSHADTTIFTDSNIEKGIHYSYTVCALIKDGNIWRRGLWNETGVSAADVIPAPSLSAKAASGQVYLSWNPVPDAQGYMIYRRETGTDKWKKLTILHNESKYFYWDRFSVPGSSYQYCICAFRLRRNEKVRGEFSASVRCTCLPQAVVLTSCTTDGPFDYLRWEPVDTCDGYIVYQNNAASGNKWIKTASTDASVTSTRILRTDLSTSYAVRAVVNSGGQEILSPRYSTLSNRKPKYTGQRILFAGDSITWGYCRDGRAKPAAVPYPTRVAQLTGISFDNAGVCGDSVALTNHIPLYRTLQNRKIDYSPYSVILLAAGTNDYGRDVPLGNLSDMTENTFCGGWNLWISAIREQNPTAQILIMLPLYRQCIRTSYFTSAFTAPNGAGITLLEYNACLRRIASKYGAEIFDAQAEGIITEQKPWLILDGVHLTQDGYIVLGDAVAKKLKAMMPADSQTVR